MATPPPLCTLCSSALKAPPIQNVFWHEFNCPRCGLWGAMSLYLHADHSLALVDEVKPKLRHLLAEMRLKSSEPRTMIVLGNASANQFNARFVKLEELLATYPKSNLEFFDRAFANMTRMVTHPTDTVVMETDRWAALFADKDQSQALGMLTQLSGLGWLAHQSGVSYVITAAGWRHLHELESPGRDSRQGFVAMWFDPSQTEYFERGFRPAIEADGKYAALRIDRKDHNNRIDDEIIAEIRRSRFVVADFTAHRNGVYFEAGLGLGLGLPVIWCVHEDHRKESHFDTRQFNHISYRTPEELREKLTNRIRATIT